MKKSRSIRESGKRRKKIVPLEEMAADTLCVRGSGRAYDLSDDTEVALLLREIKELKKGL